MLFAHQMFDKVLYRAAESMDFRVTPTPILNPASKIVSDSDSNSDSDSGWF